MKITAVRAKVYEWKGEVDKPRPHFSGSAMDILYAKAETMATFRFHGWLVVEVETSDGIVGIGNCALAPRIAKEIIDTYLTPQIIGEDPYDNEYLWQKMYRSTIAWGRKGIGMAAISAIDIALWDIKGKKEHKPVFKLLGGRTKEKLPCDMNNTDFVFIILLQHSFHFHTPLGTDEKNLGIGQFTLYLAGNRKSRKDMASRTAAAYKHFKFTFHI